MKYIKILLLLLWIGLNQNVSSGQISTFKDLRDGNEYKTIKVDKLVWFAEDLRYETEDCYKLKEHRISEHLIFGNHVFYSNLKLDSLCPYPFRMPKSKEWIKTIRKLYDVEKIAHKKKKENNTLTFEIGLDSILTVNQKLNIKRAAWVEGGEHVFYGTTTYWLNKKKKKNFHFHFEESFFIEHTHKHNIEDDAIRKRQFLVRCVCENSKFKKIEKEKKKAND